MAKAALFLADRDTTTAPLDAATIRRVNAVLLTSGMYGAAGDIAYRIGLPAKSGIGGGVLAVMPGKGTVCVWSPPLDADGNSAGGVAAIEEFARLAGWSVSDNSQPQRRCWPLQDESTYRFYTWAQLPVSNPMPKIEVTPAVMAVSSPSGLGVAYQPLGARLDRCGKQQRTGG